MDLFGSLSDSKDGIAFQIGVPDYTQLKIRESADYANKQDCLRA